MYSYAWYFLIFSFLGWCLEVGFHAIKSGGFVNRGFISGPLCPVYGVSVSAASLILGSIENTLLLFFASAFVATVVELAVGFLMDKLFKSRWWDYSKQRFNLFGYVCPKFSILWGVLCTAALKSLHCLDRFVSLMHHPSFYTLTVLIFALIIIDAVASSVRVFKFNKKLARLDKIASEVSATLSVGSDLVGKGVCTGVTKLYSEYEKALGQAASLGARIINAFPSFRSKLYSEQINVIKKHLVNVDKNSGKGQNADKNPRNDN